MSMREKAGMLQKDNIRIRKADEKDAFVLSQIDKECLSSECWSEKVFSENLRREDTFTLIAECDGREAGFINIIKVLDEADINTVVVLPSFRRKGIADMLLSEIFYLCDEINAFHLEVRESNIPAISLYRKNGFETDGMRKNFYSSPSENAILMTKRKN